MRVDDSFFIPWEVPLVCEVWSFFFGEEKMPDRRYRDGSYHHEQERRVPAIDDIEKSSNSIWRGHIRECESKSEKDTRDEGDQIDSSGHSILGEKMSKIYRDHTTRNEYKSRDQRSERESADTTDCMSARAPIGHTGTHSYEYPCDDGDDVWGVRIADMISRYDIAIECDASHEPHEEVVSPVFTFSELAEDSLHDTRYTHHTPESSCKKKCRESDDGSTDEGVDIERIHNRELLTVDRGEWCEEL